MVQEVSTQSWFSRIGKALLGVFVGLAMIIGSFILVFWNEGHGLRTAQSLRQAEKILVVVPNTPIKSENNLKVIYFSGMATTKEVLKDTKLGLALNAIKLNRQVEMYQWRENVETHTEKQVGGSEREVKTYTYEPVWSAEMINSTDFKDGVGHQNPRAMLIESTSLQAKKVKVGDFTLPANLITAISATEPVDLNDVNLDKLQKKYHRPFQILNNDLYVGSDPANPQIGDLRIMLTKVMSQDVSVIAQQNQKTLQPYLAPAGQEVALLVTCIQSPEQMMRDAQAENRLMMWIWRGVSLLLMMVGIALVLNPLVVLADVVPFIGTIVGFGTGLLAFVSGLLLWSVATALAWFVVRPLWALGLMLIAVLLGMYIIRRRKVSQK